MNLRRDTPTNPKAGDLEKGACCGFRIGPEADAAGDILDQTDAVRFRFAMRPRRSAYSLLNLLQKPDFVVTDAEEKEVLRVRQSPDLRAPFEMVENGQVVGKIVPRSLLRNKYSLEFQAGETWTFHLPLFRVRFWGESDGGSKVWAVVGPSKRQWNLLVSPGADSVPLLCGLAFVHRQWWCYN